MADVHVLSPDTATPTQVLGQAFAQAQDMRDVIVMTTLDDGTMDLAYANCSPADLAAAALLLQSKAVELLKG